MNPQPTSNTTPTTQSVRMRTGLLALTFGVVLALLLQWSILWLGGTLYWLPISGDWEVLPDSWTWRYLIFFGLEPLATAFGYGAAGYLTARWAGHAFAQYGFWMGLVAYSLALIFLVAFIYPSVTEPIFHPFIKPLGGYLIEGPLCVFAAWWGGKLRARGNAT